MTARPDNIKSDTSLPNWQFPPIVGMGYNDSFMPAFNSMIYGDALPFPPAPVLIFPDQSSMKNHCPPFISQLFTLPSGLNASSINRSWFSLRPLNRGIQ
uniref:Uncharacterized protein n=1 Tax=Salmonella sp. TaxID=599 RepID=A0A482ETH5_SALSP|nr:hypothetical protein NNIBIDOC_00178 [Salmonella sp.]